MTFDWAVAGRRTIAVASILAMSACAHVPERHACARFDAARYCMQPAALRFVATQSVEVTHPGGSERLLVHVESDVNTIKIVGLTPFGRRVLWVEYGPGGIAPNSHVPAGMNAAHVLAGLQLAFWPLEQVRGGARDAAHVEQSADGATRRLFVGDQIVFTATCEGERPLCRRAQLSYPTLGQTLAIETLEGESS